jgi:hypothetical protein
MLGGWTVLIFPASTFSSPNGTTCPNATVDTLDFHYAPDQPLKDWLPN